MSKPHGYWQNYDNCYNEAKKYNTLYEFRKENRIAYESARKHDWIKDYIWIKNTNKECKPRNFWQDYDNCYNLALKCKTISEFKNKNGSAYQSARKHDWIKDYTWFESGFCKCTKWNYENCYNEAKKYKSRNEFAHKCGSAYGRSLKRGWINDFYWLKNENIMEDDSVDCVYGYFFNPNIVYIGRTLIRTQKKRHHNHLNSESDTVYKYAKENNLEIPEMTILETNLSLEDGIKKEAYYVDYYKKQNYIILNRCKTGSIGSIGLGKWNYNNCFNEAKKYLKFEDFYINNSVAYRIARQHKWIKDYTWLQRKYKPRGFWQDYDNCYNEAKKYNTLSEFRINSEICYCSARKHDWLKDYIWLN